MNEKKWTQVKRVSYVSDFMDFVYTILFLVFAHRFFFLLRFIKCIKRKRSQKETPQQNQINYCNRKTELGTGAHHYRIDADLLFVGPFIQMISRRFVDTDTGASTFQQIVSIHISIAYFNNFQRKLPNDRGKKNYVMKTVDNELLQLCETHWTQHKNNSETNKLRKMQYWIDAKHRH